MMPDADTPTPESSAVDAELLLSEFAQVLAASPSVGRALSELASVAANAVIPPASAGITLRRNGRPMTVASSDALAAATDEIQYNRDQGPCLQSLATGHIVHVRDLAAETRWDDYPAHALAHGVGSSLSLPLSYQCQPVGALNLYAATPHAFDGSDNLARATTVARHVEAVLTMLLPQADLTQLTDNLHAALSSRRAVDQAIGIVMAQRHCTASEAFAVLRSTSRHHNRKLRDVATDTINSTNGLPERLETDSASGQHDQESPDPSRS